MTSTLARRLDALADWRRALDRAVEQYAEFLADHDLRDAAANAQIDALRQRLASDRLVLAFVAEFSRGKSELINAIFFADAGRRVLPATPGRTTMCPVELSWDAEQPPGVSLLPIDSRLKALSLAELRDKPELWRRIELPVLEAAQLAEALAEVKRTTQVSLDQARQLGFWNDEHPQDNPPPAADGTVEVPAWRHALINYPHPLLKRGLVVIDTPGLNAIGAEPELTLGLLPSAHATVFILGADTGVTKSDLEIWREHLDGRALERFVVLNKIDSLADPLSSPQEVDEQVRHQCDVVAQTLGVDRARVFPLSARDALAARVAGDDAAVQTSRLPALEEALSAQLMPQRAAVVGRIAVDGMEALRRQTAKRLGDQRRQLTEQLLELRGLRGKSGNKVKLMLERAQADSAEFERCTVRLSALKAVHARQLKQVMQLLSSDRVREEVAQMRKTSDASWFKLGARKAFVALSARLRDMMAGSTQKVTEIEQMLTGSFKQLNAEYGFALAVAPVPSMERYERELALIESSYTRYLGAANAWRLSEPGFLDHFMRMLVSKLRVVFENAAGDIEMWSRSTSAQMESQLRDRRRGFKRRREALERIQSAAGELERRITEVQAQDDRLAGWLSKVDALAESLQQLAATPPSVQESAERAPHLSLVRAKPAPHAGPAEAASGAV
ncbi:MAG TPA: dynamin family protein [Burkholderiaceae bacterium]|nr:dynamin family protein [Burkholderiaceae bacterium]